jgi:hypothetical protein
MAVGEWLCGGLTSQKAIPTRNRCHARRKCCHFRGLISVSFKENLIYAMLCFDSLYARTWADLQEKMIEAFV